MRGIESFPLELRTLADAKVAKLMREFGAEGFGVFVATLIHLYADDDLSVDDVPIIAHDLYADEERVARIVARMVDLGLLDREMYGLGNLRSERVAEQKLFIIKQRDNGSKGGRPKKTHSETTTETHSKTHSETQPKTQI